MILVKMGGAVSKSFNDMFFKRVPEETDVQTTATTTAGTPRSQITEDPRSPATVDVDRTPLPTAAAGDNQVPWDPRSPTPGIVRTPLQPMFDTPPYTPEPAKPLTTGVAKEACPNVIAVHEADVHRSWQFEGHSDLEEGDSLYPNPSSPCDLSVEVSRSDCGSLENLLMYNVESEDDSALGSENISQEPNISPIGSPVKRPTTAISAEKEKCEEKGGPRASTPKGLSLRDLNSPVASVPSVKAKTGKGLGVRHTNSPLAVVQRKQAAKVNNQLMSREMNSSEIICNKENVM